MSLLDNGYEVSWFPENTFGNAPLHTPPCCDGSDACQGSSGRRLGQYSRKAHWEGLGGGDSPGSK